MSTTPDDITVLASTIKKLNSITDELVQKVATLETEVEGLKDLLKDGTITATRDGGTAQPEPNIEVNVISCQKSSGDVEVKGSITNTGDTTHTIRYIAFLTDSNGNMITFEDGTVYDLDPGQTEYVTEWIEHSGKWHECGLKVTGIE